MFGSNFLEKIWPKIEIPKYNRKLWINDWFQCKKNLFEDSEH